MYLDQLKSLLPSYAKDIKLNLGTLLSASDPVELSASQIASIALAAAYATKHPKVIKALEEHAHQIGVDEVTCTAVKAAAAIMAMNNIYYRSVQQMKDATYADLPAKLRMSVIGNPGVPKQDFELYCLVVSAVNGCGYCLDAHARALSAAARIGHQEIQYGLRIAAVMYAIAQVLTIEGVE